MNTKEFTTNINQHFKNPAVLYLYYNNTVKLSISAYNPLNNRGSHDLDLELLGFTRKHNYFTQFDVLLYVSKIQQFYE